MQIRLLGTVDVDLDDRPLKLAGPKQRAVLSMLALSANTTVSVERLVEGLWGEEPPSTAAKMVQQYVSQLRRLLPENGAARIATHGRGYELQIDPAAVDALRFERLVARCRRRQRRRVASWRARRSRSGTEPRSPACARSRSRPPRCAGWRSCTWRRPSWRSRTTSTPGATARRSAGCARWSTSTRCASACGRC